MARLTIEDCIDKVPSRFELVALAAQRAKEIAGGAKITVDRKNDKDAVVALREIAEDKVSPDYLRESLIKRYQAKQVADEADVPEDDVTEEMQAEMANYSIDNKDLKHISASYDDFESEGDDE